MSDALKLYVETLAKVVAEDVSKINLRLSDLETENKKLKEHIDILKSLSNKKV